MVADAQQRQRRRAAGLAPNAIGRQRHRRRRRGARRRGDRVDQLEGHRRQLDDDRSGRGCDERGDRRSADPQPTEAGQVDATTTATEPPAPPAPSTIRLGGQLLPTTSGLSIVAVTYSGGDVLGVDIDGRVAHRTELPAKIRSGPMMLAAGGDWTWVRWTDESSGGSIVRAGQAATTPAPVLAASTPFGAFPGPGDTVWLTRTDTGPPASLDLVTVDGLATGSSIPLNGLFPAASDDEGAVLAQGLGGVYRLSTDGVRRITTGELVAFGPATYVVDECDDQHRCVTSVIDRATGARRALGSTLVQPGASPYGTTSPDGAWAVRPVLPALPSVD